MSNAETPAEETERSSERDSLLAAVVDVNPDEIASPALKRILEEVRNEDAGCAGPAYAYDRVHNKHNR